MECILSRFKISNFFSPVSTYIHFAELAPAAARARTLLQRNCL